MDKKYSILDAHVCGKNIDRVRFLDRTLQGEGMYAIAAAYHLDKDTQLKSGGFFLYLLNENFDTLNEQCAYETDYGMLDVKYYPPTSLLYTTNSDGSFSVWGFDKKNITLKEKIQMKDDKTITCNVIDIQNVSRNNTVLLAFNDGYHSIYDLSTSKTICNAHSHEYGLWSCFNLSENLYLTGSEDSLLKLWDTRVEQCISVNKSHQSSVNCIINLGDDCKTILTGSYEEKLTMIDIRKFNDSIKRISLGHSVWDMKLETYHEHKYLLMSSIYEGFNIWEIDDTFEIANYLSLPINTEGFHRSIVYGVDTLLDKSLRILSCSLYDNLMLLWNI